MRFLDILVVFRLLLDQISLNPVENVFASKQLAFLATSIAFYRIVTRACEEITILRWESDLRLKTFRFLAFFFSPFLFLLFFSFWCSDWPSTGHAWSWKTSKKAPSRRAIATCSGREFCSEFFTQRSEHILGAIRLITLIWVLLERSFPPAAVEPILVTCIYGRHRRQRVKQLWI